MKAFEKTLPNDYHPVYTIDAKNKKTLWRINWLSLLLFFATITPLLLYFIHKTGLHLLLLLSAGTSHYFILLVVYVTYVCGHEIVHGIAYWLLTHQKLSFGIAPGVAFCGVPDLFVYRRPALVAVLAPLITFGIVFSFAILLSTRISWKIFWVLVLTVHIGGCSGDILVACLMLFRFRSTTLLVRDTGPAQTFYDIDM